MFLSWGMLVLSVFFNAYGVFVIKLKLNELGPIKLEGIKPVLNYFLLVIKNPLVVFGIILFFLAPFLFTVALSRMSLSIAYPAQIGLNFLLLLLFGLIILKETLNFAKIIGIILILGGILFLII